MIKIVMTSILLVMSIMTLREPIFADENSNEPEFEKLTDFLKRDYFSVGAVLQIVGDVQFERQGTGTNGFSVASFRLSFKGSLDGGFGYHLQTSFTSEPAILDGSIYYETDPSARITVGRFKAPFSAEYLIGAADIDLVNRSQVVSALVPGRQIGMKVSGKTNNNLISYNAGIFNGNSPSANMNDNNDFLYVARAVLSTTLGNEEIDGSFELGANVAQSHDSDYSLHGDIMPSFSGDRVLYGADFRLKVDDWMLAGEAVTVNLDPKDGETMKPFGYHTTIGYMVSDKSQLLARWDSFNAEDLFTTGGKSDWVVLGYNHWPTKATELQINYIVDVDDNSIKHNQWLLNLQIVF